MKKWTKIFLTFGISASILGTCAMLAGAATGGVQEVLTLSNKAVYTATPSQQTITETIEKLDISMDRHEILLTTSSDDQVHLTYHNRLTGERDFDYKVQNGVLQVTDQGHLSSHSLGNGLELILEASRAITGTGSLVTIAMPKGTVLKDVTVQMNATNQMFGMVNLATQHLNLQSASYFNTLSKSTIKSGSIQTEHQLSISDGEVSKLTIKTGDQLRLDEVAIRGEVTASATFAELYLKKGEEDKTSYQLSSKKGEITQLVYKGDTYGFDWENEKEHGHHVQLGNSKASNQLSLETEDTLQIFNPKDK